MTTSQIFFHTIVNLHSNIYEKLDTSIGDLNKNSGLGAEFYDHACKIVGNTVTENLDLTSIFNTSANNYQPQFISDISDSLQQSLQNSYLGIAYTQILSLSTTGVPFDLPIHFSTSIFQYNSSISSTFLSAQMFSFPSTGIGTTSYIIVPFNFNLSGNFFNCHLFDVPLDFGVFGVNNFSGTNFNNATLTQFDYSWSFSNKKTSLIISLGYQTNLSNTYYLICYWGNNNSAFINNNNITSNNIAYSGTSNFINNIGIFTSSLISTSLVAFTSRKNFWNDYAPYSLNFNTQSYADPNTYLWSADRVNLTLVDGIAQIYQAPQRYAISGQQLFSGLNTNSGFLYCYVDSTTSGTGSGPGVVATFNFNSLFGNNNYESFNITQSSYFNNKNVPLYSLVFQKSINKIGINGFYPFTVYNYSEITPSAFTKPISDTSLWQYFSNSIFNGKNSYSNLQSVETVALSTLDNFIASYLFGDTSGNTSQYFTQPGLTISQNALKLFTQPHSFYKIDPLNFTNYEEKVIYNSTSIMPSKDFLSFTEGVLQITNDYSLPADYNFEIFKPISYVCNGIDPFQQGTGLAYDYTLNLNFSYNNQNVLQKTLYLMASKYLLSQNDYNTRVNNNQSVQGYYWLADPNSTDYSAYSVSSINDFRLYGYSALIPDLKDGVTRPILTRAFSPVDTSKYTYDQYVALLQSKGITNPDDINNAIQEYLDAGNTFYTINSNTFPSTFSNLEDISICATNYINTFTQPKYWNDQFNQFNKGGIDDGGGFTKLSANIVSANFIAPNPPSSFNVSIGFQCGVYSVSVLNIGSSQVVGSYTMNLLPTNISVGIFASEQPATISYNIVQGGYIDAGSIKLKNAGANFYYDFKTNTNCPLNDVNGYNAQLLVKMDNTSTFGVTTSLSGGIGQIYSMNQVSTPLNGYLAGFNINPNCFAELGYHFSSFNAQIFIQDSFTIDSFFLAESGLSAGSLENISNYNQPSSNFDNINYISGGQTYYLYEDALTNVIVLPSSYYGSNVSYISILCKLIQFKGFAPAGNIQLFLYTSNSDGSVDFNNIVAKSNTIDVTQINSKSYQELIIPISFSFFSNKFYFSESTLYYLTLKQNLYGCILGLKGSFSGITTSSFSISSSSISNDSNNITIFGGIGTSFDYDLDLGKGPLLFNGLPGNISTNSVSLFIRKDVNYSLTTTNNSAGLIVFAGASQYTSDTVPLTFLASVFNGIGFTFANTINTSQVSATSIKFNSLIQKNQVYTSRTLSQYNYILSGLSTSLITFGGTTVNFNFTFNKMFVGIQPELLGAFNYTDPSQFGLANPNLERVQSSTNIVDGYWSYKSKTLKYPVSIYPRAYYSHGSVIGTSSPQYQYLGFTHNIYATVGYNVNNVFQYQVFSLTANPTWKTTWMTRDYTNYKNFNISNVFVQSYFNNIYYNPGDASTNIGSQGTPKNAIFEGSFTPTILTNDIIISANIGTSSGVQVYLNNSTTPVIDTFSVISAGFSSSQYTISSSIIQGGIAFKLLYFTLGTPSIELFWNTGVGKTFVLLGSQSSKAVNPQPIVLNNNNPIDSLVFFSITKTDPNSLVNFGYPTGDSFIIRSS